MQLVDFFEGAPLGQLVYDRTYSRALPDGGKETWDQTVRRVVDGNLCFVEPEFIEPGEREDLYRYILSRQMIPAGRHLWVTGVQDRQFTSNCHVAGYETGLPDHCAFLFSELMKGGGVGANYSSRYLSALTPLSSVRVRFVCSPEHADYESLLPLLVGAPDDDAYLYQIPDSREGWVRALEMLLEFAVRGDQFGLVFDVSDVRPNGSLIKGFGGIASGPLPLMQLLKAVADLLPSEVTPQLTMEIDHLIAAAVISGNVRRSARMSIMHWDDPAIGWFLACKADHQHHWSTNISVEVDDEFFKGLQDEHSWASFVYEQVIDGMLRDGEPGFYNSSLASQGETTHIASTNPCQPHDSFLLTSSGLQTIGALAEAGERFRMWNGKAWAEARAWYTADKEIFNVILSNGISFKATAHHMTLTTQGMVPVEQLVGHRVPVALGPGDWAGAEWITDEEAVILGLIQGDGCWHKASSKKAVTFRTSEPEVIAALNNSALKITEHGDSYRCTGDLLDFFTEPEKALRPDRPLPKALYHQTSQIVRSFLRGLYSANGSAMAKARRITLKSASRTEIKEVQLLLGALGFRSYVTTNKATSVTWTNGTFTSRESYDLNISGALQYERFQAEIGFLHQHKRVPCEPLKAGRTLHPKVISVEPLGIKPVYDYTVNGTHQGWCQGVTLANCGEECLESWESCNLGSINLSMGTPSDQRNAFRLMARFLLRATFCDIQDPKQQAVVERNRRIGVGFFGLQEWLGLRDIKYSQFNQHGVLVNSLDDWYTVVREAADKYADQLGISRPIKVTAIAPTGTIAKLAGTSEGMQPIYAKHYIRRVRYAENDAEIARLRARGIPLEDDLCTPRTLVASFPCEDPILSRVPEEYVEEQHEISCESLLALQALIQRHFVDNAISLTVNVPMLADPYQAWALRGAVSRAIKKNLPRLKGVTLFPEASRPQSPIEKITEERYELLIGGLGQASYETLDDSELQCGSRGCPIR